MHAGVEHRAIRHRTFHQGFAVEWKLVGIVVGVGREHRRDRIKGLDTAHKTVVDQRAVRDLGA